MNCMIQYKIKRCNIFSVTRMISNGWEFFFWFSDATELPATKPPVLPAILFPHMRTYAAGNKDHRRSLPPEASQVGWRLYENQALLSRVQMDPDGMKTRTPLFLLILT